MVLLFSRFTLSIKKHIVFLRTLGLDITMLGGYRVVSVLSFE
jgi:hypothetical protein